MYPKVKLKTVQQLKSELKYISESHLDWYGIDLDVVYFSDLHGVYTLQKGNSRIHFCQTCMDFENEEHETEVLLKLIDLDCVPDD